MAHLLSTSNPEVAAKLQAEGNASIKAAEQSAPAPIERAPEPAYSGYLPRVGQWVTYHARPGEGRAGKIVFPAMVMHSDPRNGICELLIIYGADDFSERPVVLPWTEDVQWPAWKRIEGDSVGGLADQIEEARQANIEMASRLGDVEAAFVDFGARLAALEVKRGPGRPRNED